MSCVLVIRPGLQTTVQDAGRWGWQAQGVSVAGAMDQDSYRIANALVGNPTGTAALEIAFVGPELEFDDSRAVAVAGAEFGLTVNGKSTPAYTSFEVPKGARLRFGNRSRGSRAYVAVAGGIAVPRILGSRSTHVASSMGGVNGRALAAGDRLPLGESTGRKKIGFEVGSRIGRELRLMADTTARVRVIADTQLDRFVEGALDALQSGPYKVGHQSDRMGFRLEGPALRHTRGADIVSDVTPIGTLQVPASGQPILLMADRQTTGGYTRIATVIAADLPIAGQLGPGDMMTFEVCTLREARLAVVAKERALMAVEDLARA